MELEITPDKEACGQAVVVANMGEPKHKEEVAFDSLLKALNDLDKEQKEMLVEIKQQNRDKSIHHEFLFGETLGA